MLILDLGSLAVTSDPSQERMSNTKVGLKFNLLEERFNEIKFHCGFLCMFF